MFKILKILPNGTSLGFEKCGSFCSHSQYFYALLTKANDREMEQAVFSDDDEIAKIRARLESLDAERVALEARLSLIKWAKPWPKPFCPN